MPRPRKELRRSLNQALNQNNSEWEKAAIEFFRLLRADSVSSQTVVFGIRSQTNQMRESPFEAMTRKTNTITTKGKSEE
jgi:hypothetical protein